MISKVRKNTNLVIILLFKENSIEKCYNITQKYNCFLQLGQQKKNVIAWKRYMKNVSRVINSKKYSDEKRDFRKKRNIEKKVVSNNVISRVYCISNLFQLCYLVNTICNRYSCLYKEVKKLLHFQNPFIFSKKQYMILC